MNIPYIGITDFTGFEQVKAMLKVFNTHKPRGSNRKLHVGVMMSYKTLNGIESRYSKVFPPKENIAGIFRSEEPFNCLHYADYAGQPDFANTLARAISYGGIHIHAVQLDMTWPDFGGIAHAIHTSRKNIQAILQVGPDAFEEIGDDPDELVERLQDYRNVIHRVLLDKSMGKGRSMDAEALLPFARAIRKSFPEVGLSVAGGLGPTTMHLIEPILDEFPDISFDAQARLRGSGSNLDPIDWSLAKKYLIEAFQIVD